MSIFRIHLGILSLVCATFSLNLFAQDSTPRPKPTTLNRVSDSSNKVDHQGFIRRWIVLDPIVVSGALTEDAVHESLQTHSFPNQLTILPKDGESVVVNGNVLHWHALDTTLYNFNLYHFAWSRSRPTSNVLFWAVSIVDAPHEIANVRLAIGSNSASQWWLNDKPVIELYGDRQSVIDDGVSQRLTLRKGRNVIRAAVINGNGATDFCARFLDSNDQPIIGLNTSLPQD